MRYAVAQARERAAPLVVVRAFQFNPAVHSGMWRPTLLQAAADDVGDVFAEALGRAPADLKVQVVVREGFAGRVLVEVADQAGDVLIIGGGRRWYGGGRTARFCARRASCPVVVVPPPLLARAGTGRISRQMAREVEDLLDAASGA
jgi:nucleotide-binding universal stress UspA family protein